jgi:hypothetical protein
MIVLGFGKVTYGKEEADENANTGIAIKFTGSSDEVLFNNVLVSLGAVVEERRNLNPSATICYHTMTDNPEAGKGAFTLTVRNSVRGKFESTQVEPGANESATGDSNIKSNDPYHRGGSY